MHLFTALMIGGLNETPLVDRACSSQKVLANAVLVPRTAVTHHASVNSGVFDHLMVSAQRRQSGSMPPPWASMQWTHPALISLNYQHHHEQSTRSRSNVFFGNDQAVHIGMHGRGRRLSTAVEKIHPDLFDANVLTVAQSNVFA